VALISRGGSGPPVQGWFGRASRDHLCYNFPWEHVEKRAEPPGGAPL